MDADRDDGKRHHPGGNFGGISESLNLETVAAQGLR